MRRPIRAAALLLATLPGWIACTSREERAEHARAAVEQAIGQGNRAAALAAADDLRASLPDTADSLLEVAKVLVRAGDAPRADWLLEDGSRRFPDRDDVRLALAQISLQLGNPTRAREVAIAIPPESAQQAAALLTRARAEIDLGNLEQGLATLSEAEQRYPDRPEARLARISTLLQEKRNDEARTAIEDARAVLSGDDEKSVQLRRLLDVTLAQLQAQQGDVEKALASLRAMVQSDPKDMAAWRALVQVLAKEDRVPEALPLLATALAKESAPLELYLVVAQVQTAAGRDSEAEAALRTFAARSGSPAAALPLFELYSTRGDAAGARAALDEALARYPNEASLRMLRTETFLAEGKLDEARAELARFRNATFEGDPQIEYVEARIALAEGDARGAAERLEKLAPKLDRAATQYWLGRALEQTGDLEGALRRYALAQVRDPAWTASATAQMALAERRGDWRAVAAQAEALLQHAPRELGAWVARVEALANLGDGKAAEGVARQSLERFPGRAEPHVLLAKALRAQGRTDDALAALDEAERIEPLPEIPVERAATLGLGGRTEDGLRIAREAVAQTPDSAPLQAALASLLFAAGAADEGARATDRALALAPDEPRPLRVRCEFRSSTRDWAGARDDCTRYLAARPADAGAQFMLGVVLRGLGDAPGAAAAYRRAAELDERDPRPRNNLAELLAGAGDLDGALAAAQEAFRLDETNPYVKDTLGMLYVKKGLPERGVSLLEEAHVGLPDVPEVTFHLATAYRDVGRTDRARALLTDLKQRPGTGAPLRAQADEALSALE